MFTTRRRPAAELKPPTPPALPVTWRFADWAMI